MSKQSYNFVLWAIPRFHRTGPARVVTTTSHDSRDGTFFRTARSGGRQSHSQHHTSTRRRASWRYAIS